MTEIDSACPCGFAATYREHCEPIHLGGAVLGVTAEALMRARYSAYVRQDRAFLLESWHPDTCPDTLNFDPAMTWLGLEIVDLEAGGTLDTAGVVEFRARFARGNEHLELHERSSFERINGRWVYVSGT